MLNTITLADLSALAETLATRRRELVAAAAEMETEISGVRRRHMKRLRTLAVSVKSLTDSLRALVEQAPSLFLKPRSRTMADIQYGFKKGRGRIEFDDEQKVIARIRSKRPDLVATAIVTKETVAKDVIAMLSAKELKELGVSVTEAGDAAYVKAKDADTDKLIAMALGEEE